VFFLLKKINIMISVDNYKELKIGYKEICPLLSSYCDITLTKKDGFVLNLIENRQLDSADVLLGINLLINTTINEIKSKINKFRWKTIIENHSDFPENLSVIVQISDKILSEDKTRIPNLSHVISIHFVGILTYLKSLNIFTEMEFAVFQEFITLFIWIKQKLDNITLMTDTDDIAKANDEIVFGCRFIMQYLFVVCKELQTKLFESFSILGEQSLMLIECAEKTKKNNSGLHEFMTKCTFEWAEGTRLSQKSETQTSYKIFAVLSCRNFGAHFTKFLNDLSDITDKDLEDTIYKTNQDNYIPNTKWLKTHVPLFEKIASNKINFNILWFNSFYAKQLIYFTKMYYDVFEVIDEEISPMYNDVSQNISTEYDEIRRLLFKLKLETNKSEKENDVAKLGDLFLNNINPKKQPKENIDNLMTQCDDASKLFSKMYTTEYENINNGEKEFENDVAKCIVFFAEKTGINNILSSLIAPFVINLLNGEIKKIKQSENDERITIIENMLVGQPGDGSTDEDDHAEDAEKYKQKIDENDDSSVIQIQKIFDNQRSVYERSKIAIENTTEIADEQEDIDIIRSNNFLKIKERYNHVNQILHLKLTQFHKENLIDNTDTVKSQFINWAKKSDLVEEKIKFLESLLTDNNFENTILKNESARRRIPWLIERKRKLGFAIQQKRTNFSYKRWKWCGIIFIAFMILFYTISYRHVISSLFKNVCSYVDTIFDSSEKAISDLSDAARKVVEKKGTVAGLKEEFVTCYRTAKEYVHNSLDDIKFFPATKTITSAAYDNILYTQNCTTQIRERIINTFSLEYLQHKVFSTAYSMAGYTYSSISKVTEIEYVAGIIKTSDTTFNNENLLSFNSTGFSVFEQLFYSGKIAIQTVESGLGVITWPIVENLNEAINYFMPNPETALSCYNKEYYGLGLNFLSKSNVQCAFHNIKTFGDHVMPIYASFMAASVLSWHVTNENIEGYIETSKQQTLYELARYTAFPLMMHSVFNACVPLVINTIEGYAVAFKIETALGFLGAILDKPALSNLVNNHPSLQIGGTAVAVLVTVFLEILLPIYSGFKNLDPSRAEKLIDRAMTTSAQDLLKIIEEDKANEMDTYKNENNNSTQSNSQKNEIRKLLISNIVSLVADNDIKSALLEYMPVDSVKFAQKYLEPVEPEGFIRYTTIDNEPTSLDSDEDAYEKVFGKFISQRTRNRKK